MSYGKSCHLTGFLLLSLFACGLLITPTNTLAETIYVRNIHAYGDTVKASFDTFGDEATFNFFTNYELNVYDESNTNFIGKWDAFCVEGVAASDGNLYDLLAAPSYLLGAAWIADQYWNGGMSSTWGRTATQIAIWEAALDYDLLDPTTINLSSGIFELEQDDVFDVASILENLKSVDLPTYSFLGPVSLAHNPIGTPVPGGGSQDYLVKHSVPEPATIALLGLGLIGVAVFSRKKLIKKR